VSLPPPRQELPDLLLDAIRSRDAAATARLTRQWAHRHGVTSLETFRTGGVIGQEGPEAGDWLRQQLEGGAMAPGTEAPAGVDEAFAALDMAFSTPPKPCGQAPASAVLSSGVT